MADDDYKPGSMDVSDQRATYENVMNFGSRYGVPLSLALTGFFTFLLLDFGFLGAIVMFAVIFGLVHWIAKTFFSH